MLMGIKSTKDNKGFSLVELIVAISIGAIVASSIAGLIAISVRLYGNETGNTSAQYEVQTTLNQMVNSIEQAQWFDIKAADANRISYAAFGKKNLSGNFVGDIYQSGVPDGKGRFNIYMNRYEDSDSQDFSSLSGNSIISDEYLLSEGVTSFAIDVADSSISGTSYTNPILIKVSMDFEKDGMGKVIEKHIEDQVYLRNHVKENVHYKGSELSLSVNSVE